MCDKRDGMGECKEEIDEAKIMQDIDRRWRSERKRDRVRL